MYVIIKLPIYYLCGLMTIENAVEKSICLILENGVSLESLS